MKKLRILEHISLDSVIQAPGGRDEDGDYPHGGWAAPYRSAASTTISTVFTISLIIASFLRHGSFP